MLTGLAKDDPAAVPPNGPAASRSDALRAPPELARVIRFLAGDESAYITAQNLRVNEGATRSV